MRALYVLLALTTTGIVSGHSYMSIPKPEYQRVCERNNVRKHPCVGPCVPDDKGFRGSGVSQSSPAATYKRGQMIRTEHFRNNHDRGFVRYSIVPLDQKMNAAAHAKYAFRYSCFNDKKIDCGGSCGSDTKMFRTMVTIPTYVPDGVYIFSWAWYGGGRLGYGDMYTCSYVEIKGGPMTASGVPEFIPTGTYGAPGKCRSYVNEIGICLWTPCRSDRKAGGIDTVPVEFENGKTPPAVTAEDYGGNLTSPTTLPVTTSLEVETTTMRTTAMMSSRRPTTEATTTMPSRATAMETSTVVPSTRADMKTPEATDGFDVDGPLSTPEASSEYLEDELMESPEASGEYYEDGSMSSPEASDDNAEEDPSSSPDTSGEATKKQPMPVPEDASRPRCYPM